MTNPNLPASAADVSRLIARVEELERKFRNVGLAGQDSASGVASLSWAELHGDELTGLVADTTHNLLPDGTSVISGTDIEEGTSAHMGHIATDGIYAVVATLRMVATSASDTFHTARFSMVINEASGHPTPTLQDIKGAGLLSSKHQANATISWAGFLSADSDLDVQGAFFGGGGGTWEWSGGLLVSRLA